MTTDDASGLIVQEPCAGCGDETAIGSALYSDRRRVDLDPNTHAYLCTICDQRIASSRRGKRLTDDALRDLVHTGQIWMLPVWPPDDEAPGG